MICGKKHDNEIKDIPLLIVPSAQDLALHGAKRLDIPIQSVNPELRAKPRFIKPDYSHPDRTMTRSASGTAVPHHGRHQLCQGSIHPKKTAAIR